MYKTERGKKHIDSVAKRWPRFWHYFGTVGAIVAIFASIFIVYTLLVATAGLVAGGPPALALVLPGTGYSQTPGVLFFPWYVWVIAIGIMFIPHELSHGVLCRRYGIKVKSVGLMLLAVLPGAFVEPDEKQLARSKLMNRLRIYAVGSFVNIITSLIFLAIIYAFVFAFQPVQSSTIMLHILNLFRAIFIVTLGVGLANLLPIYPLDGGKFFHDIVANYMNPKSAKRITLGISVLLAFVIVFNIAAPLLGIFG